jgi:hypothetical protein
MISTARPVGAGNARNTISMRRDGIRTITAIAYATPVEKDAVIRIPTVISDFREVSGCFRG